jgi:diguanylate cyclase (GGDEF)-like protein
MIKIPIRLTVLGLFLFLSALILGAMFYIQSNLSKELSKEAMNDYFEIVSLKIEKKIEITNNINVALVNSSSAFIKKSNNNNFSKNEEIYLEVFSNILKDTKKLYSIYIGFYDDKFYEVIKLDINEKLRKRFNAKDTDKWLQIEISNTNIKKISLFDKNLLLTSKKIEKNNYKPTQRPWYKNSIKTKNTVRTEPYLFSNIDARGITYSKKIDDKKIFAIDVLINNFSETLNNKHLLKSLESYIFTKKRIILATSATDNKIFKQIIKITKKQDLSNPIQSTVLIDGQNYIYNISYINNTNKIKEYLLSYVLLEEMSSPYKEKFNEINKILILMILLLLPLMWYFASIIVKPILALINESQKVQNREFDNVVPVSSIVKEVEILSISIRKMANSIHNHQTKLEQKVEDRTKELIEKNKELKILSITDKLTNTYNRIKIDSSIDKEIHRVNRYGTKFGIIMLDIDHFKEVNDVHGHLVGDTILVEFSNILKEHIRETDILGRWGGEEFIIISVQADLNKTIQHAEIIRSKIENFAFTKIKTKTASFGVATYQKGETAQQMVNRADKALYLAKDNGRNRVETIEPIEN